MPFNRRTLLQRAALAGGGLLMPSLVARRQTVQHHHSASTLSRPSGFPVSAGATAASFSQAVTVAHAGDVLVISGWAGSISLNAVSGGGATWTQVIEGHATTGDFLWIGVGASVGSQTIAGTFSASGIYDLVVDSLHSSTPPTWTVTSSANVAGTAGTTITMPSLSGSGVSAYIGYSAVANGPTAGSTTGFIYTETDEANEYMLNVGLANGTAYAPTFTQSASGANGNVAAVVSNAGVGAVQPVGGFARPGGGLWTLQFFDEFTGSSTDTSKWGNYGNENGVNTTLGVTSGGVCSLTLTTGNVGAMIDSSPADGAGVNGYLLGIGSYVEARILFPGSGTTIYNWPAFWTLNRQTISHGEYDIAECLGPLTMNYHPDGSSTGPGTNIPGGTWSNAFHVYGLYIGPSIAEWFWDGVLVYSTANTTTAAGSAIIINLGNDTDYAGPTMQGAVSTVQIDYVRAWT